MKTKLLKTAHMNVRHAGSLALSLLALALLPSLARADSIVYIKDNNVWLMAPDASKQTAVTTDGSPELPYQAPSQADNGTIAVAHGTKIVLLQQNGEVIRELDPPPLIDSTSHPVDGTPSSVAISPDATKIAYGLVGYGCPIWTECMARATTGVIDAAQAPPKLYGQVTYGDPQWVSTSRLMVFGGYLSQVNLWDLGQRDRFHWFDDQDWAGSGNSTDLGDGDLSRDGRIWVGIRGYDDEGSGSFRRFIWFKTVGNPATDTPPPVPEDLCIGDGVAGTSAPSIAPSGNEFVFQRPDGIWIVRNVVTDQAHCGEAQEATLLPGGREPDWGPADVNPQPRVTKVTGETDKPAGKPKVRVVGTSLRAACRRGLKVAVAGLKSGKALILVRRGKTTVAKATVQVPKSGAGTFVIRFSKPGAKKLCVHIPPKVKLTVTAAGVKRTVILKRRP